MLDDLQLASVYLVPADYVDGINKLIETIAFAIALLKEKLHDLYSE